LFWKRDVFPLVPFFIVGIASGLVTERMEQNLGAKGSVFHFSIAEHCLIAGRDIWFYLGELLWPANLTVTYPRWDINPTVWWQYLFPAAVLALLAGLWRWRTSGRGPLTAALFFIGTLFPALDFLNVYYLRFSFVADHLQYLACLGPIVLAAAGINRIMGLAQRKNAILGPAGCAILLATLGILTWRQCRMYHDPETLWRATIAKNPGSWLAENNLGLLLAHEGKANQAVAQFNQAIAKYHQPAHVPKADPEYCRLLCNIANALLQEGNLEESVNYFHKALQINPDYVEFDDHDNLGNALFQEGLVDEAIVQYQIALQLKPDFANAYNDLGNALFKKGDIDGALAQYQKALQTQPDSAEACYNLGNVLFQKGNVDQAVAYYKQALQLKPGYAEACINLGNAWLQNRNVDEAIAQYQQALQIAPDSLEARNNLGNAWLQKGNPSQAIVEYQKALQIQPDSVNALNNLAWVLATSPDRSLRDGPKAVKLALQANRLTGNADPDILGTLATAYAEAGQFPEAVDTAQRAIQLAEKQSDGELANSIRAELKLFQSGIPFHSH
jgi:tetratricopeptide (TPR) repeat protein